MTRDNSSSVSSNPAAMPLARHLLDRDDVRLDGIEPYTWMATAHYLSFDDHGKARLIMTPDGSYELAIASIAGSYTRNLLNGHVEQTPIGDVLRDRAQAFVRNVTGHDVTCQQWLSFAGIASGRHMVPRDTSTDHSFMLLEIDDGTMAVVRGNNPAFSTPEFEREPFFQGRFDRFETTAVSISEAIRVIDEQIFLEAMEISTLSDLTEDVLRKKMTVLPVSMPQAGLDGMACHDLRSEHGFIKFDITAQVSDFGKFVARARTAMADCFGDRDWYPASPENALDEFAMASNANPSPDEMGFEIVAMLPRDPEQDMLRSEGTPEMDQKESFEP